MNHIQSPDISDPAIEREIVAKGLTAARVTPQDIEANIACVEYVTHVSRGGQVMRWAVITTRNGFAVTGRPSVAVSPQNDDVEIGEKVARANAINELWPLMGFALKERLAGPTDEQVNRFLGWQLPRDFGPDAGISFDRTYCTDANGQPAPGWPVGTNLLSAEQAKQMLAYVLRPLPQVA